MPKALEKKLKQEYGANSSIPYKIMNKMGMMKGNKVTMKGKMMDKKDMKTKWKGKGMKAKMNSAAEKSFWKSKMSK